MLARRLVTSLAPFGIEAARLELEGAYAVAVGTFRDHFVAGCGKTNDRAQDRDFTEYLDTYRRT